MTDPVSTRLDEDIYERIQDRADENDQSVSDILRNLIEAEFDDEELPVTIVDDFASDLRAAWATGDTPNVDPARFGEIGTYLAEEEAYLLPEEGSVLRQYATEARPFVTRDGQKEPIQDALFEEADTVYVAGHGSSLSVAHWLASRLRRSGVRVRAANAARTAREPIREADALVSISRSGRTDTLLSLAESVPDDTTHVAVTQRGRPLTERADHTVHVAPIDERVEEYASKSLFAQLLSLLEVVFDELPAYDELVQWGAALDAFVTDQFDGGDIDDESQFVRTAVQLENCGDLGADPIVSSAGTGQVYGHELHLKLTELLHVNAAHEHASMLRDRLVNTLFREETYLLTFLPRAGEVEARTQWEESFLDGPNSLPTLLNGTTAPGGSVDYRLVTMGFDDVDSEVARQVQQASRYGRDAYIPLTPAASATFTDATSAEELPDAFLDLYAFTAGYLFAYAALERRWKYDRQLRQSVIKRVYRPDADEQ